MTFPRSMSIRGAWAPFLLALLPALLAAQTPITAGRAVTGRLSATDPTLPDGSHYQLYEYRGQPGERLQITMRSSAFDTYMAGGTMQGSELSASDTDDDGGGGTDSQLTVTLGPSGSYVIRANSLSAGQAGGYTLTVERLGGGGGAPVSAPAGATAGAQTIAAGQTVSARLEASDPLLPDGSHYETYVYRGQPGEQVTVLMHSSDFDAYLAGGTPQGADIDADEFDDDSGGGRDAMLSVTVPSSGVYGIRANSLAAGVTGAFTLTVQAAGGAAGGGARTVSPGETVGGRLQESTPRLGDGSHYDTYYVDARAGDRLFVTMTSGDFDAYLRWGREQGGDFETLLFDDDGAGGTNARLEIAVETTGR